MSTWSDSPLVSSRWHWKAPAALSFEGCKPAPAPSRDEAREGGAEQPALDLAYRGVGAAQRKDETPSQRRATRRAVLLVHHGDTGRGWQRVIVGLNLELAIHVRGCVELLDCGGMLCGCSAVLCQ